MRRACRPPGLDVKSQKGRRERETALKAPTCLSAGYHLTVYGKAGVKFHNATKKQWIIVAYQT